MKNLIYFDDYFYYFGKKGINIKAKQTNISTANKKKKKNKSNFPSNISSNIISNNSKNSTQSKDNIISNHI